MKKTEGIKALSIWVGFSIASFTEGAIMSPDARENSLDEIRLLLSSEVRTLGDEIIAEDPAPFIPDRGEKVETVEDVEVVLSDEELLEELSKYVNPTGIFMFGGEFYLIFKEKKMKIGSELGITFNGAAYNVIISDITGSTYKISRGDSELQLKLK